MPLTPETLTRHELIGVPIRVADAPNPDLVGLSGRVVSETMQTFVVATPSGEKRVPKAGTTFEMAVVPTADQTAGDTDEAAAAGVAEATPSTQSGGRPTAGSPFELGEDTAGVRPRQSWPSGCSANHRGGCEDGVYVTVDGSTLCSRPAARTERTGDSKWR